MLLKSETQRQNLHPHHMPIVRRPQEPNMHGGTSSEDPAGETTSTARDDDRSARTPLMSSLVKQASSRHTSASSVTLRHDEGGGCDDDNDVESCHGKMTSCRWVLGYMCCAARFCQSAIRQCIGMAVVCMAVHSRANTLPKQQSVPTEDGGELGLAFDKTTIFTNSSAGDKGEQFVWSPELEGLILNSFNIGFFFSPILGGHIAGRFGGKRVVLVALLAGSIVTICLPLTANFNVVFVILLRALAGFFLGVTDPAIQALWARWAPKHEKAQLTTCSYTGLSLAGIVTFYISGHLCGINMDDGWPFIFYFFGGFTFLCAIPWMFLVHDSPEQHPRISDYELDLITKGKGLGNVYTKVKTPWKDILTSGPFWAIVIAHMTYTWVTSWMMSYLPKYLNDILNFDVKENGLYSSLPYVGRLMSGFLSSYVCDKLQRLGVLSTGGCRKLFQLVGGLGCAGCTLCVGFLNETSRGAAVTLLVLAMSFQNVTSIAFRINHLDIAPRFAGVMMGMTVTAAMGFSLTAPPITAAIIKDGREEEWMIVFIIVASLNIIGAVVFGVFASGEIQEWGLQANDNDYKIIQEVSSCDSDSFNDTSKTRVLEDNTDSF